jgi:hypothetical protein
MSMNVEHAELSGTDSSAGLSSANLNLSSASLSSTDLNKPESTQRQAISQAMPFILPPGQGILSGRPKGAELLEAIMVHIRQIPENSVTSLDFSNISFMDVSCADEMLNKLIMRIRSGELGGRYVTIRGANTSLRETIEAVLHLRDLSALAMQEGEVVLLGELKRPMREALDVIINYKSMTSAEMSSILKKNVNIVCNRLNALQRMGLVCRLRDGSVAGGGRQYYYVSIL